MDRLAFIADIHGNHLALLAVLDDIKRKGVKKIFCLGDLVGYGPFPNEVIEIIRKGRIPTVMGNYDDGVGFDRLACGCDFPNEEARRAGEQSLAWTKEHTTEDNKAFLRSLPKEIRLRAGGRTIQMVHGSPRALNEYLFEDTPESTLQEIFETSGAEILVVGHTHKPFHRLFKGNHLINAGSVGRPKHGDPNAVYCIMTLSEEVNVEFPKVPYDSHTTAKAILDRGLPEEFASLLLTGKE